jgi:Domain of unknown function (DUF397)
MSDFAVKWMRSSFCSDTACIEAATLDGDVVLRDGKHRDQPFLRFSHGEWHAFLDAVAAGEFRFQ